jgi:hypothetical protein
MVPYRAGLRRVDVPFHDPNAAVRRRDDVAYGARIPGGRFLRRLFEPVARRQTASYRRSGGTRLSRMMGFPVVLLTTTGAK